MKKEEMMDKEDLFSWEIPCKQCHENNWLQEDASYPCISYRLKLTCKSCGNIKYGWPIEEFKAMLIGPEYMENIKKEYLSVFEDDTIDTSNLKDKNQ